MVHVLLPVLVRDLMDILSMSLIYTRLQQKIHFFYNEMIGTAVV